MKREWSNKWRVGNVVPGECYVYMLEFDGGGYYVGHSDNIRARLVDHDNNECKGTAGKEYWFRYFERWPDRVAAVNREKELKELLRKNKRAIRDMLIRFEDLVKELDWDK